MNEIKNAILIFILFTVILGILYPLAITGISQLAFPAQANGNLIRENGTVVGSQLIGQNFSSPQYFHGRPSVIDYNSSTSSGSNLGPTNQKLINNVSQRIQQVRAEDSLTFNAEVPADLVLSSGSGLEGYIYADSARIQVTRIARARGISESVVYKLIADNQENSFWGSGKEIVNVLKLNIALNNLRK
jgi:K+-transporting ATPase ATPase C chain